MTTREDSALLTELAAEFSALPEVTAVVMAGSKGSGVSDSRSDLDVCVYAEPEPSTAWRADLARRLGSRASIDNHFWEPGDEWVAQRTGGVVDVMYRAPRWIEEQIDRVMVRHEASVGYSTCFLYNVLHSVSLYDRSGWFASLHARASQPYPDPLRRAVVAKNHPILRRTLSSYLHQIELALARDDCVSVNHRVAALLASYFDILFAVNRLPHPGEKRQVAQVLNTCSKRPHDCDTQIRELLRAAGEAPHSNLPARIADLIDGLDEILLAENLILPA
jgi:predicted nucleotidyltransferase